MPLIYARVEAPMLQDWPTLLGATIALSILTAASAVMTNRPAEKARRERPSIRDANVHRLRGRPLEVSPPPISCGTKHVKPVTESQFSDAPRRVCHPHFAAEQVARVSGTRL